jgi:vacuolar protein sorting-associated protein 26
MEYISKLISKAPSLHVQFDNERTKTRMRNLKGDVFEVPTFNDIDNIKGRVIIELNKNKNFEHSGIKIEFSGIIENYKDKKQNSKFISINKDILPSGVLDNEITQIDFEFNNVDKLYETYRGKGISVRYILFVTLEGKYKRLTKEQEIIVHKPIKRDDFYNSLENKEIRMDIGIEDWFHVGFEVFSSHFHLRDVVAGEVTFKKVSVKLQSMEMQIVKRETVGAGSNAVPDNDVLYTFEVMDGAPFRNETIPIRIFLNAFSLLSPSYSNVNNKFSVQYFLNLVLIDWEDRRYFKQHEIFLHRLEKMKRSEQEEAMGKIDY